MRTELRPDVPYSGTLQAELDAQSASSEREITLPNNDLKARLAAAKDRLQHMRPWDPDYGEVRLTIRRLEERMSGQETTAKPASASEVPYIKPWNRRRKRYSK